MRIILSITCCLVLLVCLGQLDAERCVKNTRRKPNRCSPNKVCCLNHVSQCVKKKRDIDNEVYYKICTRSRRNCSCMQGCIITQYGSIGEVDHFIPIGLTKTVGCIIFGCKAIYSMDYRVIGVRDYEKGRVYGCTNFQLTEG